MNIYSWFQLIFYMVVLLALAKPLGTFMAKVYQGEKTFLDPVFGPVERFHLSPRRRPCRRRNELEGLCHRLDGLQCSRLVGGICSANVCRDICRLIRKASAQ